MVVVFIGVGCYLGLVWLIMMCYLWELVMDECRCVNGFG